MHPVRNFLLAFDIDHVLAHTRVRKLEEIKFYQQKGFVLTAIKTHYVFPGVVEMMQLLFKMPDVKIFFFSSGHQIRNELFVEKLLEHALGKDHYLEVKNNVRILSGKKNDDSSDLVNNTKEESTKQCVEYGLDDSNYKKSLEKIIEREDDLANSILIDDDSTWIKYGQEHNYLHVPPLHHRHFVEMEQNSKYFTYDESGQMKIPIINYSLHWKTEYCRESILNARFIGLLLENENCILRYTYSDQTQEGEIKISQESNHTIFQAVKKYDQKKCFSFAGQNNQPDTLTKEECDVDLYALIEEKNGKTAKINLECNRICYVVGVLFKALEHARAGFSLKEFLFPMHFSPNNKNGHFKPRFHTNEACDKKEEYYYYGLEELKKVNPHFTFIDPKIYQECCETKITEEEELALEKIYKNEGAGSFWI